ncbi:Serine/threonine-protein kinase PknB [Planctomycetes bacterium Poly30]|uniref:Serine/threonine-protein kinase PknB n=1 Tax=Saltatorellus ferox TaxID=2528018 RepID=A0A518EPX1_9BACT|nr:Serine/threonine-protein kinase PknB [Planctomycetes bacterium Poly30]
MDTRQVVARFEAERQALALMDHPHIAKVMDVGATDRGRPYFVMELVKGKPIVEYCDQNSLPVHERLALMAEVCRAVQHAHGKGIIHRDLKPTNVLVGTQDGQPSVKVIDFGIAKATSQTLTEKTLFTEMGQIIGSLQYMSPEQAEGSLDVDTRTDVYSLGIMLYELLTGGTPFDLRKMRGVLFGEIQRLICEVDPPKPSTRMSESAEVLDHVAARRRVAPERLGLVLRGELDWIVMKALEKDRSRRYGTANELGLDIERYLAGDAVLAAPPGAGYRLRKLVRRHRLLVGAAAAVAVALLAGVIAFAWQARVATGQRDRALQAEAEAEAEARADELEVVASFQANMLEQLDATTAGQMLTEDVMSRLESALESIEPTKEERSERLESFRRQWTLVNAADAARELIDRLLLRPALTAIDEEFAEQPLVDARLRQVLADRYRKLGLYDAALPPQLRALKIRRETLGEDDPRTLSSLDHLGLLRNARGEYDAAERDFRAALEGASRVLGEEHPQTLEALSNVGTVLASKGEFGEAESFYRDALEKHRRVLGDDHRETITAINNVGFVLDMAGKLEEAESYYRDALETARRVLGEEDAYTMASMNSLAVLLHVARRLDEAEPLYREALEKRRRLLGAEHPDTLSSLANLGALLKYQGNLEEAETLYREALEKKRRILGEDHPETLISLQNLGSLLRADGRRDEAVAAYREALAGRTRVLGPAHPSTLNTLFSLASLLAEGGDDAATAELLFLAEVELRILASGTGEGASAAADALAELRARASANGTENVDQDHQR